MPAARGVAMIIVLLLMLAITGIAVFSARYAVVGEAASQNKLDAEIARQAAEAALRDAERDILLKGVVPGARCSRTLFTEARFIHPVFRSDNCLAGQCRAQLATVVRDWADAATAEPWWPAARGGLWNDNAATKPSAATGSTLCATFVGGVPLGTYTNAPAVIGVAVQPEYLLEYVDRLGEKAVRITSRGFGLTTASQVVLQAYFKLPSN